MGYRGPEEDNLGYVPSGPHSDYHHVATPTRKYSRQNSSYTSPVSLVDLERPQTLEIPLTPRTPLRSSLRKNSSYSNRYAMGGGGGSSGGTPTNPTPPDSLYDDTSGGGGVVPPPLGTTRSDSGFVSTTTSNRVRFSPSPFDKTGAYVTDWSPTHESPGQQPPPPPGPAGHRTIAIGSGMVGPNPGGPGPPGGSTTTKSPFPMQRHNRAQSSNHHYITERDLQRDFNLYQKN